MNRTAASGLAVVLMLGLAACSEDEPRPDIAEPTVSASPTTPVSTNGLPGAHPELPDDATAPTRAAAIAFTKYFWQETNYAQATGDVSTLSRMVAESCSTCQAGIQAIKRTTRGSREVVGGEVTVEVTRAQEVPSNGGTAFVVEFDARNTSQRVIQDGDVIDTFDAATVSSRFLLNFSNDRWRVDIWRIGEK